MERVQPAAVLPEIDFFQLTDTGCVREGNEDAIGCWPHEDGLVFAVADGLGGHNAGEVASALALEVLAEEIKNASKSARTDIYSLGAILYYEMLAGKVPFPSENVYAAMRSKVHDDPIPPRRLRHEIAPQLKEIVLHALERNPHDRFESALEMRAALAHPESVPLTGRANRRWLKSTLPRGLINLLILVAGVAGFALLL